MPLHFVFLTSQDNCPQNKTAFGLIMWQDSTAECDTIGLSGKTKRQRRALTRRECASAAVQNYFQIFRRKLMENVKTNALAASYRADLLYYIERAKLGKCPPHWQAYCFGEIADAKGTDNYPADG